MDKPKNFKRDTMNIFNGKITLITCLLLFCSLAKSQQPKYAAILIGNSTYKDKDTESGCAPLPAANNDVEHMTSLLRSVVLTDTVFHKANVSKEDLEVWFPMVRKTLNRLNITHLIIYYSGHGFSLGNPNLNYPDCDFWVSSDFSFHNNFTPFASWSNDSRLRSIVKSTPRTGDSDPRSFTAIRDVASYLTDCVSLAWVSKMFSGFKLLLVSDACRSVKPFNLTDNFEQLFASKGGKLVEDWLAQDEVYRRLPKTEKYFYSKQLHRNFENYISHIRQKLGEELQDHYKYIVKRSMPAYGTDSMISILYSTQFPRESISGAFTAKFTNSFLQSVSSFSTRKFSFSLDATAREDIWNRLNRDPLLQPSLVPLNRYRLIFKGSKALIKYRVVRFKNSETLLPMSFDTILYSNQGKDTIHAELDSGYMNQGFKITGGSVINSTKGYQLVKDTIYYDSISRKVKIIVAYQPDSTIITQADSLQRKALKLKITLFYVNNKLVPLRTYNLHTQEVPFLYGKEFDLTPNELSFEDISRDFEIIGLDLHYSGHVSSMQPIDLTKLQNGTLLQFSNRIVTARWDADRKKIIFRIDNPDL